MAGFRQFFSIFMMEFINIGPVYSRGWVGGAQGWGWWEGCKGTVGGGKSLIKEEIRHKE